MAPLDWPAALLLNPRLDRARPYGSAQQSILSVAEAHRANSAIERWPDYAPTPLHALQDLAQAADVAEILFKDEGYRFDLKSFKALGGAYAVERLVQTGGRDDLTVTCATDGNHGRAVAWGAQRTGARAVIFVHEGVSEGRAAAIGALGATIVRAGRTYDEAVRLSAEAACRNGWQIVSDTSWPGYEDVPRMVMQGYALLIMEALEAGARPTHIFIQGGVGGLAAGLLSYLWETLGPSRPVFVVVEPDRAACLFESARRGQPTAVGGDLDTVMAGLACGEPSRLAWRILDHAADAFMTITDEAAVEMMRDLADRGIVSGESGVAGLAGARRAADNPTWRTKLRLGPTSRILCIGTEGATDAEVYARLVGRPPEAVRTVAPE
jgi:diaminopropionate ammonia-lyase